MAEPVTTPYFLPEAEPGGQTPTFHVVNSPESKLPPLLQKALYNFEPVPQVITDVELREFRQIHADELNNAVVTTILLRCAGVVIDSEPLEKAAKAKLAGRAFGAHMPSILPDTASLRRNTKPYLELAPTVAAAEEAFYSEYINGPAGPVSNLDISEQLYDTTDTLDHPSLDLIHDLRSGLGEKVRGPERLLRYILLKALVRPESEQ